MLDLADLQLALDCPAGFGTDPAWAEELSGFNVAQRHTPDVVVGARTTRDVAAAVAWSARRGLPVGVQATGHGMFRPTTSGVLVSTARMTALRVDPERRTATVGAGVRWREVVDATAPHGLAPLSGSSAQVGVVGYTLGGGLGLLARRFGFAADLVVGMTVVTATGDVVRADPDHEPDLFWALRGGKAGFGVVTELEFRLVSVPAVYGGSVFFAGDAASEVLQAYQEWVPSLPDEATTSIALISVSPDAPPEAPMRGKTVVHLRYIYCDDLALGADLLAPMLTAGPTELSVVGPMAYTACDDIHLDPVGPLPIRERTCQLAELPSDAVEVLAELPKRAEGTGLFVCELRQLGGALRREPEVPNSVPGRDGEFAVLTLGLPGAGGQDALDRVLAETTDALRDWHSDGALPNWIGNAADSEVALAWPAETRRRLASIRAAVDPDRVFRFGHGV